MTWAFFCNDLVKSVAFQFGVGRSATYSVYCFVCVCVLFENHYFVWQVIRFRFYCLSLSSTDRKKYGNNNSSSRRKTKTTKNDDDMMTTTTAALTLARHTQTPDWLCIVREWKNKHFSAQWRTSKYMIKWLRECERSISFTQAPVTQ